MIDTVYEGVFDFSWPDRAIETLVKEGIRAILGIPTVAAPKWLMDKFPDIYPIDAYGLNADVDCGMYYYHAGRCHYYLKGLNYYKFRFGIIIIIFFFLIPLESAWKRMYASFRADSYLFLRLTG